MNANLIELKNDKDTVFVGDTHGDFDSSKRIIESYPLGNYRIVFLGDYVDRGPDSRGNIDYLLEQKEKHPVDLILLAGNHEFASILPCSPDDFWRRLNSKEKERYSSILTNLPWAVSIDEIIALHAALPDIKNINEINKIAKQGVNELGPKICSDEHDDFFSMIWGDFVQEEGGFLGYSDKGRPAYGKDYFKRIMDDMGKNVLIRGHDYHSPEKMYHDKCLTLFTSCAYEKRTPKRIAILEKGKSVKTANDLEIKYL